MSWCQGCAIGRTRHFTATCAAVFFRKIGQVTSIQADSSARDERCCRRRRRRNTPLRKERWRITPSANPPYVLRAVVGKAKRMAGEIIAVGDGGLRRHGPGREPVQRVVDKGNRRARPCLKLVGRISEA